MPNTMKPTTITTTLETALTLIDENLFEYELMKLDYQYIWHEPNESELYASYNTITSKLTIHNTDLISTEGF
jgi:hypothetical protein